MLLLRAMNDAKTALKEALKAVGGQQALASLIGITAQAISQWDEVPPLRVLAVERASGVSRHDLRPDLYPLESSPPDLEARA